MDFNKSHFSNLRLIILTIAILFLNSCFNKDKINTENIFYVEFINITDDSLKTKLEKGIIGKVSFYMDKKLEIVSINYVTENLPEMHYFKNIATLDKGVLNETIKISVEYIGDFHLDSISYTLQKFKHKDNEWVKISDMGEIKDKKIFVQPVNIINEYARKIILNIVQYSYN